MLLLLACGTPDTSFTSGDDDQVAPEGDAAAELDPPALVWDAVDVGYSFVLDFTVRSVGTGDLAIYEISLLNDTSDSFVFDRVQNVTLAPGEEDAWPVTCDLEAAVVAEATLRVRTSDPAQNEVMVPLTCNPA